MDSWFVYARIILQGCTYTYIYDEAAERHPLSSPQIPTPRVKILSVLDPVDG